MTPSKSSLTNRLGAIVLCLITLPAIAANNLERLMELSGLNHEFDSFPAQIQAGMQQSQADTPDDISQSVNTIMQKGFDPASMKAVVKDHLQHNLSAADINASLQWLESPLGRKITALENAASGDMTLIQQAMPQLLEDTDRFALIRSLDQAINVSEATVNMLMGIQAAMLRGLMVSAPEDQRWDDARIDAYLAGLRPQIKAQYELLTIASMAYTYRSLEDSEVQAYIDFANSPAGQRYHTASLAAMDKALSHSGKTVGEDLGNLIVKYPQTPK